MSTTTSMAASKENKNLSDPLGLFSLIPLDLVLEILYSLPVKSLLTLKCVSKTLNSLISDPKFAKDHFRLSRTCHYHLLLCPWGLSLKEEFLLFDSRLPSVLNNSTSTISGTKLNFPINSSNIDTFMIDSCYGIVCFRMFHNNEVMVVWNPCTRKFKISPPLENRPSLSTKTMYSFGYDQFTDSYKVVVISCYQFNKYCETQVRVHTLGTNFWRTIPDFPSQLKNKPTSVRGKYVSGAINWVIRDQENDSSWVILSLDLGNESCQEILQPDYGLDEPLSHLNLGVSRDCLCVLAHTETFLNIWVMKDYRNINSWTKLFTIPFTKFIDCYCYTDLLYISEEDDQVFLDIYDNIYVYNYNNGTVQFPWFQVPPTLFTSNVYVESLISP